MWRQSCHPSHRFLLQFVRRQTQSRMVGNDPDRLLIELSGAGTHRDAALTARGAWEQALARNAAINAFLGQTRWAKAERRFLPTLPPARAKELMERWEHAVRQTTL
mgnify:CR=1 FL=1